MASQFSFDAIGTHWIIDIADDIDVEREFSVLKKVKDRIDAFDKVYSRFREDSLVTEMSRKGGTYALPEDSTELFSIYRKFYDLTAGRFTPLIGDALADAGYDAKYSLKQARPLSAPPAWDDAIFYSANDDGTGAAGSAVKAAPYITIKKAVLLDLGAAGKGYLVDLVGRVLQENGIVSYCIDAGGDIRHRDPDAKPLRVGLEDPENTAQVIGVAVISNASICGSAGNRRAWGEFHHIIDPERLTSPRHILATWVVAESTVLADAIATALFFVSPEAAAKHHGFSYLILNADRSVERSPDFPGEIFTAE